MVIADFVWLLIVLYGVECFWAVLDGSGRFLLYLWIDFSSSALISMLHDDKVSSRFFLPFHGSCVVVFHGCGRFFIPLMVMCGVGCFWPF